MTREEPRMDAVAAKRELRQRQIARRKAAVAAGGAKIAAGLASHGQTLIAQWPGAVVSGFSPMHGEVDPLALMAALVRVGHPLALPAIVGRGSPLAFRSWAPGDALVPGTWGIGEPSSANPLVTPSVLLVPLLAYDRQGWRLGYGGGYYDRTLAGLRDAGTITAIGIAVEELEVDAVPHLDYDQRLDWILTPSGPLRCSG